mmetsp:Transcript_20114/g.49297  ORF Transcript_20114/g.49297 Transcript_20114/m.49297 type:complete len:277 (+) Transcript_20114:3283-4113(+)
MLTFLSWNSRAHSRQNASLSSGNCHRKESRSSDLRASASSMTGCIADENASSSRKMPCLDLETITPNAQTSFFARSRPASTGAIPVGMEAVAAAEDCLAEESPLPLPTPKSGSLWLNASLKAASPRSTSVASSSVSTGSSVAASLAMSLRTASLAVSSSTPAALEPALAIIDFFFTSAGLKMLGAPWRPGPSFRCRIFDAMPCAPTLASSSNTKASWRNRWASSATPPGSCRVSIARKPRGVPSLFSTIVRISAEPTTTLFSGLFPEDAEAKCLWS